MAKHRVIESLKCSVTQLKQDKELTGRQQSTQETEDSYAAFPID
jgi:hypothetical protein